MTNDKHCPYIGGQTIPSSERGPEESFVWCEVCPGDGEAVFAVNEKPLCLNEFWKCQHYLRWLLHTGGYP
jgi:hypothetical protein